MALVKFYRGSKANYDKNAHKDGVYFALDTKEIIVNEVPYGYSDADHREVDTVTYTSPKTITIKYTNGTSDTITLALVSQTDFDKFKADVEAFEATLDWYEGD